VLPHKNSYPRPARGQGDLNGDGLDDYIFGGIRRATRRSLSIYRTIKGKNLLSWKFPILQKDQYLRDLGISNF